MNCYEKQGLLNEHIQDMEKRLGAYLWVDGCEKTDKYARSLIAEIQAGRNELAGLYNKPTDNGGDKV